MLNKYLYDSAQEIKRADHLIYVSLKYTRTIDVMNNILDRLIATNDFLLDGILGKAKKQKKIDKDIPIPGLKVEKIKELYPDNQELHNYLYLYILFRKIRKASQMKHLEFRRGVTMTAMVDNQQIEVTIDIITDYYKRTMKFLEYLRDHFDDFLEEHHEEDYE